MTKWGRKKTTQTMSFSTSNIFSKLWLSRFKNTNGSEGCEFGPEYPNKILSHHHQSSDDDGFTTSLCSSEHKLNVSPVGYGKNSSNIIINDQPKIRDLMSGEADEDFAFEDPTMKIKSNDQNHRKSFHISRKHGGNVKCCKSPRKVANKATCKSFDFHPESATEKKPLMKTTERVIEDAFRTGLDSFAIVKTSYDPQHDFRESMIEMIMEKQIREPEELEELLACYLTLNCDGYHDLIVKVFRRVWFELNNVDHFDQHVDM